MCEIVEIIKAIFNNEDMPIENIKVIRAYYESVDECCIRPIVVMEFYEGKE